MSVVRFEEHGLRTWLLSNITVHHTNTHKSDYCPMMAFSSLRSSSFLFLLIMFSCEHQMPRFSLSSPITFEMIFRSNLLIKSTYFPSNLSSNVIKEATIIINKLCDVIKCNSKMAKKNKQIKENFKEIKFLLK